MVQRWTMNSKEPIQFGITIQGPRSNFEIGGTLAVRYCGGMGGGGAQNTFSY